MLKGFYQYEPIPELSLVAAGLISILLIHGVIMLFTTRAWFMHLHVVALSMEVGGLVARAVSASSPENMYAFIVSIVLVTLAPSVQAANLYMLAGRVILQTTPPSRRTASNLWINHKWFTTTFVLQDVLAFTVQLGGVGMIVGALTGIVEGELGKFANLDYALKVMIVGFSIQIFSLTMFLVVVARYHSRSKVWCGPLVRKFGGVIMGVIYSSTVLLLLRTVYRLCEFIAEANPKKSWLVTNEWPFWTFEMTTVFMVFVLYVLSYPGEWFQILPEQEKSQGTIGILVRRDTNDEEDYYKVTKALHLEYKLGQVGGLQHEHAVKTNFRDFESIWGLRHIMHFGKEVWHNLNG